MEIINNISAKGSLFVTGNENCIFWIVCLFLCISKKV